MAQWDVKELSTNRQERSVVLRGQTRTFVGFPKLHVGPPFFRAAFGVYREGLNSVSPFYALLCFYRVIEGSRAYGARQGAYARQRGIEHDGVRDVVEDIDDLGKDFPEWIGRTCGWAAEQLYKEYRLAVAHGPYGLGAEAELHDPDQLLSEDRYWRAVPMARQVARKLLLREWRLREKIGLGHIRELDDVVGGTTPKDPVLPS
jgi:hypothetical protein